MIHAVNNQYHVFVWYLCYADRAMKENICNLFFFYGVNTNMIHDFPDFGQYLIVKDKI